MHFHAIVLQKVSSRHMSMGSSIGEPKPTPGEYNPFGPTSPSLQR